MEIDISESSQSKARVFLSMMHSPKPRVIKISNMHVCECMHTQMFTHIGMCVYKYIQPSEGRHMVISREQNH